MGKVYYIMAVFAAIFFTACQEDDFRGDTQGGIRITLAEEVGVDVTTRSTPEELTIPIEKDFTLKVVDQATNDTIYNGKYTSEIIPVSAGTYTIIAEYGEDVVLDDGTVVPNAELTYRPYRERSFAYLSDTLYSHRAAELVSGVDLLYHEATFADEDRVLAKKTGHSTAKQAAQAALAAGAGRLLIGHFSSRYKDLRQLEEEAREVFPRSEAVIEEHSYEIPCNR